MKPGILVEFTCQCHKGMLGIALWLNGVAPSKCKDAPDYYYQFMVLDPRKKDGEIPELVVENPSFVKPDCNPLVYRNAWLCLANNFGEQDNKEALALMDEVLKSVKEAFNDIEHLTG